MRRALAALAVCLLAVTAGCTTLFGDDVTDGDLDKEPPEPYDWSTTTNGTYNVRGDNYQAVLNVSAIDTGPNETTISLYYEELARKEPLSVRSVRYRYPNGTVVNGSDLPVQRRDNGRFVTLPSDEGKFAYTAGAGIKQFGVPGFVRGSHEVVLPSGSRTGDFFLGDVSPGGYESEVDDEDRLHLQWDDTNNGVYVRYYLSRDLLLFRGLVVVFAVASVIGGAYYLRVIRGLEEKREEIGLGVDTDPDDEFDDGPPPGMK